MPRSTISLLIIDHHPQDRENLRRLLTAIPGRRYAIREAQDAAEGARAVREKSDCILLDYRLPEKDGVRLLEQIAQEHGFIPAPIVLTAPLINRAISTMALNLGAQDVLAKNGITAEMLERSIDSAIVRHQITRERDEAVKALAHRENLLRMAQEAAHIGNFDLNLVTREITLGGCYLALYGLPPDRSKISFKQWMEMLHPEDRAVMKGKMERLLASGGAEFSSEFRVIWPDRSVHWILSRGAAFRNERGGPIRITGINMDVTAAKSTEQALATAVADLQQFAYSAGHDLQAPLRSVGVYADVVAQELSHHKSDILQQALVHIRGGVQKMHEMLGDLMSYAKAGAAHVPEFHPVELAELLKAALKSAESDLHSTGTAVTWDTLPTVLSHNDELVHVFQNLLTNAVKYRRPGVPLRIHVDAAPGIVDENGAREVVVSIRDNGQGFEMAYARLIFEPFTRLAGGDGGTGLGLAICKRIITRHGGRIWAESDPEAGSTFFFTLPLASAKHSTRPFREDRKWTADVA